MKKILIISISFLGLLFPSIVMAQNDLATYRKIGPVYLVSNINESESVISIAEYKNATDNSWHYFLRLHSLKDNRELSKKEIAITHDKPLAHEQLIGMLGDIYFIMADSLIGYDTHTLEALVTESTIIAENSFMVDNISRQHNNYLLDEGAGVMYVRGENDNRYKLFPGSSILKTDDGNNELAPDNFSYEIAANYTLYDRYKLNDALTCIDTADNNLYILGSEKETGYVLSYFGTAIYPEREEIRQLTMVPYHADGEQLDYKVHPPTTTAARYFKGGFLQQKFFTTAWKNKKGDRVILFHANGIKQLLCVALVDKNGKEKWRSETGCAANTFVDYLVGESNLILWFNKPNSERNAFEASVVNVELGSGTVVDR